MGIVRDVELDTSEPVHLVRGEEWGNEVVEGVSLGQAWVLACILRTYDPKALDVVFLNSSTGATTGWPVVEHGGTNRAGYLYSARAAVMAFTPFDLDHSLSVVMYKVLPMLATEPRSAFGCAKEWDVGCVFVPIQDAAARRVKMGYRKDLVI